MERELSTQKQIYYYSFLITRLNKKAYPYKDIKYKDDMRKIISALVNEYNSIKSDPVKDDYDGGDMYDKYKGWEF